MTDIEESLYDVKDISFQHACSISIFDEYGLQSVYQSSKELPITNNNGFSFFFIF
jgi:hypothetical protein